LKKVRQTGLRHTSPEVLRAAAMLAQEFSAWKDVSFRSMFGMQAVYRGNKIFALLPGKRAPGSANSFAFKFPPGAESKLRDFPELRSQLRQGRKWLTLELQSPHDLQSLLEAAATAYRLAR
jgi:hypothetical protein